VTGPLVLIEPYAYRLGGHHQRTLVALTQARPCSLVIASHGIVREAVAALREAGARLVTAPAGHPAAVLLAASRLAAGLSRAGLRVFRSRRWPRFLRRLPHQITLIARCLAEASALRTARRLEPGAEAVVILSASEALHGAAALLGGLPHLRFVHEQVTTEDAAVRFLGRLARRGERQALAVCPTQAVGDQFTAAFPDLPAVVRAFAVDDGRRPHRRRTRRRPYRLRHPHRRSRGVPGRRLVALQRHRSHRRRADPAEGAVAPGGHRHPARRSRARPMA
jgi:hypothetical protein